MRTVQFAINRELGTAQCFNIPDIQQNLPWWRVRQDINGLNTLVAPVGRHPPLYTHCLDASMFAVGWETGDISVIRMPRAWDQGFELVSRGAVTQNAVFDICWLPNKQHSLLASSVRTLFHVADIEQVEQSTTAIDMTPAKVTGAIKSLHVSPQQPRTRCGQVVFADMRMDLTSPNSFTTLANVHSSRSSNTNRRRKSSLVDTSPSITCARFMNGNEQTIIASTDVRPVLAYVDMRNLSSYEYSANSLIDETISASLNSITRTVWTQTRQFGISWFAQHPTLPGRIYATSRAGLLVFDSLNPHSDGVNGLPELVDVWNSREFHHGSMYIKCQVSPDGNSVGCTSSNGKILIWDVNSDNTHPRSKILDPKGDQNDGSALPETGCIAFHPSSEALAAGFDDGLVRVWNRDNILLEHFESLCPDPKNELVKSYDDESASSAVGQVLAKRSQNDTPLKRDILIVRQVESDENSTLNKDVKKTPKSAKKGPSPGSRSTKKSISKAGGAEKWGDIRKFIGKRPRDEDDE